MELAVDESFLRLEIYSEGRRHGCKLSEWIDGWMQGKRDGWVRVSKCETYQTHTYHK